MGGLGIKKSLPKQFPETRLFWPDFWHHLISLLSKNFSDIFVELKLTNCKDQVINHSNIYLLIGFLGHQESIL